MSPYFTAWRPRPVPRFTLIESPTTITFSGRGVVVVGEVADGDVVDAARVVGVVDEPAGPVLDELGAGADEVDPRRALEDLAVDGVAVADVELDSEVLVDGEVVATEGWVARITWGAGPSAVWTVMTGAVDAELASTSTAATATVAFAHPVRSRRTGLRAPTRIGCSTRW